MKNAVCLAVLITVILVLSADSSVQAQSKDKNRNQQVKSIKPKPVKKTDCCDCDYIQICNFSGTRKFDGISYKILKQDENNISYYNCDNGEVTVKWITSYTPDVKTESDYDPISNTETTIYYHEGTKYKIHTKMFLKCNEPDDGHWISNGMDFWIIKADTSMILDGERYNHIKIVREGIGPYIYYAKGLGPIREISHHQYQSDLKTELFEKSGIDPEVIGIWVEDKDPGYWASTFIKFNEDGTGESGSYNQKTKVLGKPAPFEWRITGNTLYRKIRCTDGKCFFEIEFQKLSKGVSIDKTKYRRL